MSSYNEISCVNKNYLSDYHVNNKMRSSNEISCVHKNYLNDHYDKNLKNWFKNRKFFKK